MEQKAKTAILFPPFRLEVDDEQLWRDSHVIPLRPRTFAVLRYLVEHAGRLVTKAELLHAVWADTQVSEEGLRDYLREIRQALGDESTSPRFVATVRGRGYRFIGEVVSSQHSVASREQMGNSNQPRTTDGWQLPTPSALPLPDKPSIIVLPFVNLSNNPEQEYFSDGITEDLTNSLSRFSSLFVISRTSAFTYKGKPTKVQDISRELGVQYVLEGSVRKADNRVRITAQLIDATADHHLWTERYDRPLQDIFALQDEIVQKIVTTLKLQFSLWKQGIPVRKNTENVEAYDFYLRGLESLFRAMLETKKEANGQARQLFERALELDPMYALVYAGLGWTYFNEWFYQWNLNRAQSLERALELAHRAITLDGSLPMPHMLLGHIYLWSKHHDQAIAEVQRAIALDPNSSDNYLELGIILVYVGRPEEAVEAIKQGMRLNPRYIAPYPTNLGWAYRETGRCEEALAPLKEALRLAPSFLVAHSILAGCYAELGRQEEAEAEAAEVLRLNPQFSLEGRRQMLPYKDPVMLERFLATQRKAGLK